MLNDHPTCSDKQGADLQPNKHWKRLWSVIKEHTEIQKRLNIYLNRMRSADDVFYAACIK